MTKAKSEKRARQTASLEIHIAKVSDKSYVVRYLDHEYAVWCDSSPMSYNDARQKMQDKREMRVGEIIASEISK